MQNLMLIIYNLLSGLSNKPFESYDGFSLDHLFFFFFVHTFEYLFLYEGNLFFRNFFFYYIYKHVNFSEKNFFFQKTYVKYPKKLIKNWVFFRTKFYETLLSLDASDKNYHDIMILYERPTI